MPEKPIAYRGSEPFVFVSYAHADAELAYPIISGLQERGMRIWFDDGLDAGDIWEDVIPDHVEQCAAMLCLVSTRFTDSKNCKNEIRYASELNKGLLILHLETGELPRHIRFHYSAIHVLRLSDYSDHSALLDKLSAAQKLRCCIGQAQKCAEESNEDSVELLRKGIACYNPKSYGEAVSWFRRAADKGNDDAMHWLADCYRYGCGVPQSWAVAVAWYRRAADKGHAPAMCNLSYFYANGQGVTKDKKQAEYWRNKAEQAEADASN
jgi:hypothetical protein